MRIELLLFLCFMVMAIVMIAGSLPRRPTPALSPTLFPAMRLATYEPQLIARAGRGELAAAVISPSALAGEIDISPPRCYRGLSPTLTCLGVLRNLGASAIRDIRLNASYIAAGEPRGEVTFALERRLIEAKSAAAYRLLAQATRMADLSLEIGLAGGWRSAATERMLALLDERGEYLAELKRYQFSATLKNEGARAATGIRLIVALENGQGEIIGYRGREIAGPLPGGGTLETSMTVAPLGMEAPVRHRAWLEALPAASSPATPGKLPSGRGSGSSPLRRPSR